MASVNSVVISGRATRDPELKTFGEGGKVVNVGIASDRSVKQGDDWVTVPNFVDVSVFGNYAELIDRKLRKGDLVTVQGELRYDTWDDQQSGAKRSKVFIVASTIDGEFAFRKADGSDTPGRSSTESNGASVGDQGALPVDPTTADVPF